MVSVQSLGMTANRTTVALRCATLDALAYRPVTGKLCGYSNGRAVNEHAIYLVDPPTVQLTNIGPTFDAGALVAG